MRLLLLLLLLPLSGCLSLSLLPRDHDSVLAGAYVDTKLQINTLSCQDKKMDEWVKAIHYAAFVKEYTILRDDPQKKTADGIPENLQKALDAENEKVCGHWLKLTDSRMKALETAWSGR